MQTEDYARALLGTLREVTAGVTETRLRSRMERQKRVLYSEVPPKAWFIVDEHSLYRQVGSAQVMAGQMRHLIDIAAMPNVTLQVLSGVGHPAGASGFMIADGRAAYAEHVVGGYVFTGEETVSTLLGLFDTLRGECRRVSETTALIERIFEIWTTGGSPATPMPTAETA